MLVPDDKPAHIRTAEHYRQYRQQLAKKGAAKENHAISTKNNMGGRGDTGGIYGVKRVKAGLRFEN
jgi:hypothetical protein